MLKPYRLADNIADVVPAAFRRLCVETPKSRRIWQNAYPAAFRRLCVETATLRLKLPKLNQPPSGGCVLKHDGRGRLA